MLKKWLIGLGCLSLGLLVACESEAEEAVVDPGLDLADVGELETSADEEGVRDVSLETSPNNGAVIHPEVNFDFEVLDAVALETLENQTEFDYALARGMDAPQGGIHLLVRTWSHLTDFQVISIGHEVGVGPTVTGVMYHVGDLTPYEPLLIRSYFGHGTFPVSGFSLIDEQGTRRYFSFIEDQSDKGGFVFNEFTLR